MGIAFGAPVRTLETVLCDTPAASAMSCIVGMWPGMRTGPAADDFTAATATRGSFLVATPPAWRPLDLGFCAITVPQLPVLRIGSWPLNAAAAWFCANPNPDSPRQESEEPPVPDRPACLRRGANRPTEPSSKTR